MDSTTREQILRNRQMEADEVREEIRRKRIVLEALAKYRKGLLGERDTLIRHAMRELNVMPRTLQDDTGLKRQQLYKIKNGEVEEEE